MQLQKHMGGNVKHFAVLIFICSDSWNKGNILRKITPSLNRLPGKGKKGVLKTRKGKGKKEPIESTVVAERIGL